LFKYFTEMPCKSLINPKTSFYYRDLMPPRRRRFAHERPKEPIFKRLVEGRKGVALGEPGMIARGLMTGEGHPNARPYSQRALARQKGPKFSILDHIREIVNPGHKKRKYREWMEQQQQLRKQQQEQARQQQAAQLGAQMMQGEEPPERNTGAAKREAARRKGGRYASSGRPVE